jgi:predicted transcriptional regulator YdeE
MAELVSFEIKKLPKVLLIGKQIRLNTESFMKGENPIPEFWDEVFAHKYFEQLEAQTDKIYDGSYVGVMLDWMRGDGEFSYVIGMLMMEDATVPDGFVAYPLGDQDVAVGWIKGEYGDVIGNAHRLTEEALKLHGRNNLNMNWFMELYNCPRYTNPDENGHIILDYYIPLD